MHADSTIKNLNFVWTKYINHHAKTTTAVLLVLIEEAIAKTTIEECVGYKREVERYLMLCSAGVPAIPTPSVNSLVVIVIISLVY